MTPTLASPDATPSTSSTASAIYIRQPHYVWILRSLWLIAAATTLLMFASSVPITVQKLTTLCMGNDCATLQLTAQGENTLRSLGLSLNAYSNLMIFEQVILLVGYVGVGTIIFWRKPLDIMVVVVAFVFATWVAIFLPSTVLLTDVAPFWREIKLLYALVGAVLGIFLTITLPDGRFYPRWTRWYFTIICLTFLFSLLLPHNDLLASIMILWDANQVSPAIFLFLATLTAINALIQVYRYNRYLNPIQRQQTKWIIASFAVIVAFGLTILAFIIFAFPEINDPSNRLQVVYFLLTSTVFMTLLLLMPVGIMFSALRYRLWDVDIVINRSLVYGGLTLLLGGIFLVAFFVLKAIWGAILGSGQEVIAAVLPAVFITLIFNPTRKRVQSFVDRRIYGLNFDLNQLAAAQKAPEIKNAGVLTGRKLGGYDVLDVIGKGGMGEVYKGQAADGQVVALKVLPDDLAKQEDFRKRFEREGQALTALQHPNIVRMIGSGSSDGIVYLAMEYLNGDDLSWKLKLQGVLTLDETRDILTSLCLALDYAHEKGFVHRDIKPSNVMLRQSRDGETLEAVLMDFGVAKVREAQTAITGTGGIGTIGYMAPEQIMAAKEVDNRADIYALGVMAYEMLTGELPFKGSPAQVMFAHLQQPPPDPRDVNDDLSSPVAHAILRALAKQPDDRFSSAGEFAAALG